MVSTDWDDVVDLPDELDDETVEVPYERAAEVRDIAGEVCPPPRGERQADATARQSGDGRDRIFPPQAVI